VKFLVWKRVFKALVLVMHFFKHVNMGQQKKNFVKSNLILLNQPSLIYKSVELGQRNLEKEDMNGIKLALILEFVQES
jgi:hypothetical protein